MPTYEYQCKNCHHTFELMQKISEDPVKICPSCGKVAIERLVSAAGFQLKGTGWYVTDFKNKPRANEAVKNEETTSSSPDKKTTETVATSNKKGDEN